MKKYFKKGLSVFLSLLMVFTSLVFVVPEFKAEAATAGKYYVRFSYTVENKDDNNGGEYTGSSEDDKNGMKITYTNQDGTTGTYIVSLSGGTSSTGTKTCNTHVQAEGSYTCTAQMSGLPTNILLNIYGSSTDITEWYLTKVEVSTSSSFSTDTTTTLWTGYAGSHVQTWLGGTALITVNIKNNTVTASGDGTSSTTNSSNGYKGVPTASQIKFISGSTSITIPKTGESSVTNTYTAGVYDQYGVRMTYEPTFYLKTSAPTSASASNATVTGVSIASSTGVLTTTSNAQMSGTTDSKTIYIHAVYSTIYANRTVTLKDPTYTMSFATGTDDTSAIISPNQDITGAYGNKLSDKYTGELSGSRTGYAFVGFYGTDFEDSYETVNYSGDSLKTTTEFNADSEKTWYAAWQANSHTATFNYKDTTATDVTTSNKVYYGQAVVAPEISENFRVVDTTYTFTGWSPEIDATMPDSNTNYTAQYTTQFHEADYTAVDAAIARAAEVKANDAEYDLRYTEASRLAVEQTIGAVVRGLGESQQATVDGFANAINTAIDSLTPNKFVVLFVDEDGSIIKDGYHFVDYGTALEVPASPEKEAVKAEHYVFTGWDEDTSACANVVEDLVFTATFSSVKHTWSSETVPSTCTTNGVIKYTCSVCNYSYTVANGSDTAHHTWKTEKDTVIAANCGKDGLKATFCEVCGVMDESTLEIVEAEAGTHTWGTATVYTPATCLGSGTNKSVCTVCGEEKYEIVKPTGHQNGTAIVVTPTCTVDGYTYVECQVCGHQTVTSEEPATGHRTTTRTLRPDCVDTGYVSVTCENGCGYGTLEILPATGVHTIPDTWTVVQQPTCASNGLEKRECSVCYGEDEYRVITTTIEHTFEDNWTTVEPAQCGIQGLETRYCTACSIASETRQTEALEHEWVSDAANSYSPTCEDDGVKAEMCAHCYNPRTEILPKLGHNYVETNSTVADCTHGATKTFTCTNDETHTYTVITALANGHSYTETTKQYANCTDPEIKVYTCSCGESYEEITAVPNGHTWEDNWTVTVQPTETTAGKQVRFCTVCNNAYEEATIPATSGHVIEEDTAKYVAATCTTSGLKVFVCTTHENCEADYTETIKAEGHNVVMESQPATCTAEGYVKAYCDKDGCGTVIGESKIPMLSHSYTVEVSTTNATCNRDGERELKCTTCDATTTVVTPKTGHTYTKAVTQNKDCTKAETTTHTCHCGHYYTEITAVPTGHNFIDNWEEKTPATADTAGELIRYCTRGCGAYETAPIAPNGGHEFVVDDAASKAADCTTEGKTVYVCTAHTDCGVTYEHVIAATGHSESLIYQPATCDADGYTMTVCSTCKDVVDAGHKISKLGHKYVGEITTAAGCGTKGVITYTCQNDASHTYTEEIAALQHDFSVEVEGTRIAPTCITDGSVTKKCLHCDATQFEVISKTGHDYLNGVVIEAGDCVTAGKIEYTCENDPTHKFTEVTPPTGAHDYTGNDQVVYAATCTTGETVTQYCNNCKNHVVLSEGEPLGHDWSAWVVTKAATADEYGVQERTCQRKGCGEVETMTLTPGRTFKITFYDIEGVRITKPTEYNYGSAAIRPEVPLRVENSAYTYEFEGWRYNSCTLEETEKMLDYLGYGWDYSKVEGEDGFEAQESNQKEMAFVAQYKRTEQVYTVNYCDSNGNVIHTMENVLYSDVRSAWDVIPTKESTEKYDYTFSEWHIKYDKDPITGENVATATAIYTQTVRPDYEGPSEPTLFDKIIQSIRDFFNKILTFLGLGV